MSSEMEAKISDSYRYRMASTDIHGNIMRITMASVSLFIMSILSVCFWIYKKTSMMASIDSLKNGSQIILLIGNIL